MSDITSPATPILLPDTAHTPAGAVEHRCEHPGCKKWGGRGYQRGKGEMVWFCFEHCAEAEGRPVGEDAT